MAPVSPPRAWGPSKAPGWRKTQGLDKPPKLPKAPKITTPKTAVSTGSMIPSSSQHALDLFRTTLAQIRSLSTPVDKTAILQPYQDASVATGQLGTGLATALQGSGQAAQDQYNQGRNQATAQGAAFGISSGAGADAMVRPGELDGNSLLAQQTQANAAAAHGAATAWQGLLGRLGAGAVSKAVTDRADRDYQVATSLAGNIPTWAQNEDTLNFQKDTARKNYALALGTASDKKSNELRNWLLDVRKQGATEDYNQGLLDIGNRNAATGEKRTQAQITAEADRVSHWNTVETRLKASAKKNGLTSSDVNSILKTLKGPTGTASKGTSGYTITRIATDPSIGQIPGTESTYFSTIQNPPQEPGWTQVGTGKPVTTTGSKESQQFSWSRYKAATNLAKQYAKQRGVTLTAKDIIQMLGPTPKTK